MASPTLFRPPTFSGSPSDTLSAWLSELELFFLIADLKAPEEGKPDKRAATAALLLTGTAKLWWASLSTDKASELTSDYTKFSAAVKERFRPLDAAFEVRAQLKALHLQDLSSFEEFALSFQVLAAKEGADLSHTDVLHALCAALPPQVAEAVLAARPDSTATAIEAARTKVATLKAVSRLSSSTSPSINVVTSSAVVGGMAANVDSRIASLEAKLDALLGDSTSFRRSRVTRPGSRSSHQNRFDERGRPLCNVCGSPEHLRRHCPRRQSVPDSNASSNALASSSTSTGRTQGF